MSTSLPSTNDLVKIYRKSIAANYKIWAEELHCYLGSLGISKRECRTIAIRKAYFAEEKLSRMKKNVFGHIDSLEHAFSIYCAYIRHEDTNYDEFCAALSGQMHKEADRLSKEEVRALWRMQSQSRDDYKAYENACRSLRDNIKKLHNLTLCINITKCESWIQKQCLHLHLWRV